MKRLAEEELVPDRPGKKVREELQAPKALVVAGDGIDDVDLIKIINKLDYDPGILDFSSNYISNKGAKVIAQFLHHDKDRIFLLRLHQNQIGEEGYIAIAKSLNLGTSLGFLSLSNNQCEIELASSAFLEKAVINSESIVYAYYNNKSAEAEKILSHRNRLANAAIDEWVKYKDANALNELPYHLLRVLNLYKGAILTTILVCEYGLNVQQGFPCYNSFVSAWAIKAGSEDILRDYGITKNSENAHLPIELWKLIYSYVPVRDIKFEKASQTLYLSSNSDTESEEIKSSLSAPEENSSLRY
ncbi:MAG: hypothetical protein K0R73_646 [Candidatus Midichloriaceae bacterium]|nr:hypothetical protein [Candidatus Midichloriaceae bacterium]